MSDAKDIIERLQLSRHPEGGWYSETFRDRILNNERAASTAIYYLLEAGDKSHWHTVDATEVRHFHAGAPLELSISPDGVKTNSFRLGLNFAADERPQIVVPATQWQSAKSLGDWTLVGCTVAPGFEFSGFEMAPNDWSPGKK